MPSSYRHTGPTLGHEHYAIAYCRVSTGKQGDSGLSLEGQKRLIGDYAKRKALRIVATFREVESAKGPLPKRTAGAQAMELIRTRKAAVLVVTKIDRAFRSSKDMVLTLELLEKYNATLHIVELGGLDPRTPHGAFTTAVLVAAAEWERNMASARTKAALDELRRQGKRTGEWPYGHFKAEVPVLARMKELRREGVSFRKIAAQLEVEKLFNRKGNPHRHNAIQRILARTGLD